MRQLRSSRAMMADDKQEVIVAVTKRAGEEK
jgi:hypothetical protein